MFQNLGNTLALLRNLRRKSQAQIARDAGIGRSQLSKYENGTELPGLDSLSSILGALDMSIHEFLFSLALVTNERLCSTPPMLPPSGACW